MVKKFVKYGIEYGIGGVAGMEHGEVPGSLVLSKYLSFGSKRVILSRSFHDNYQSDLKKEIDRLRLYVIKNENNPTINSDTNLFDDRLCLLNISR
mgnify:CR=1 FL=1